MEIKTTVNGTEMTVALEGRLDTTTAPNLEKELETKLDNINALTFEFEKLQYISSAGLRVLLGIQKKMNAKNGSMIIKHLNEMIMEVFEMTGFIDILNIEN